MKKLLSTVIISMFAALLTPLLKAQDSSENNTKNAIEEVIVTGTRIKGRTATQTAAPIDIISSSDIESFASDDIKDIMAALSPSFSTPTYTGNDDTSFVRPPLLRGMPAGNVLVLVNGKRVHRSAVIALVGSDQIRGAQAVDMGQFSSAAVKRVEVLRDGAAAQYGSDAIAGVINLILKDDNEGGEVSLRHKQYYEGEKADTVSINWGFPIGDSGFLNLSFEDASKDEVFRGEQPARARRAVVAGIPVRDFVQKTWGPNAGESQRFSFNSTISLNASTELYAFGNTNKQESDYDFFWRRPSGVPNEDFTGTLNPSSPFKRSSIQDLTPAEIQNIIDAGNWNTTVATIQNWDLHTVFPGGFTPRFFGESEDIGIYLGARGKFKNSLSWDVSYSVGENEVLFELHNTTNPSLGPLTPFNFELGGKRSRETKLNADFSFPWNIGNFSSPINVAFGFEEKEDEYELMHGELASYQIGPLNDQPVGSNGFPGISPSDAGVFERDSTSVYVDLETDVTDKWLMGFAIRSEDYSDFGSTTNSRLSTRYQVVDSFALRGVISTGFAAPTIAQLSTTSTSTNAGSGAPVVEGLFPSTSLVGTALGGKPLKPQKSDNFSFGMIFEPMDGLTVTLDYYSIDITDRLVLSSTFDVTPGLLATLPAEQQAALSNIDGVRYFSNAFDSESRGIELVTTYDIALDDNILKLSLALSKNDTEIVTSSILQVPPASDPTSTSLIPILARNDIQNFENGTPNKRATFTANYDMGKLSLMLRGRYYGEWITGNNTVGDETWYGSKTFWDISAGYDVNDMFSWTLGFQNIADKYPEKLPAAANAEVGLGEGDCCGRIYSSQSPYNYTGGSAYLRLRATF